MNSIKTKKPNKNKFDLSHEVKMTGNMGDLMPCYMQDVIPGDSLKVNTQQLIRFSPLLAPVMHNIDFKVDYFFVPYRLVWDEWKDFITGGEDGNDLPSFPRVKASPTIVYNKFSKGKLADYLGIPTHGWNNNEANAWSSVHSGGYQQEISVLPFRAYQLIYHEYFRDQNVGTEYNQYKDSGLIDSGQWNDTLDLRKTNWEKDYFTSALPFLQRGGEVNLGGTVTVTGLADGDTTSGDLITVGGSLAVSGGPYGTTGGDELEGTMDLTINELRKASALQQWLELMARAGSRYREQIHAIFGERIPDYTVQVPQYLGGGKTPIMISEVLSTYSREGAEENHRPLGDMGGHALGLGDNLGFRQSFNEHGIVLGLARIVPRTSYVQGLSKFWQKFDKFDHYFPQFANLGEQPVYNKELYIQGKTEASGTDEEIFGYQQRYAEYKYAQNRVSGEFRDTLAQWELSRRFTEAPLLNQSFVECNPDTRIFAIGDEQEHKLWMSLFHKVDALRPIPYFSIPQLT